MCHAIQHNPYITGGRLVKALGLEASNPNESRDDDDDDDESPSVPHENALPAQRHVAK